MSFFDIQENINRKLYGAFNIASDIVFNFNKNLINKLKINEKYRNVHKGDRCFIVATGPSINKLNPKIVNMLESEIIFGVNSLYKSNVCKNILPKYYTLMDNLYWDKSSFTFSDICSKYENSPPTFITDVRASNFIPKDINHILLYAKNYPVEKIKYDISKNISITMNVVGYSIVSAMFMGFERIYLLGCDYSLFCSPINNHCYDDREEMDKSDIRNLSFYLKYYHLTTEFHYLIARTAKNNGICIENLTDGSLLDAYPRNRAEDVLKDN